MSRLKESALKNKHKGFLLLEVLVCVVVITVGLVYIIRSFSISTRAIATSRDYMKAASLLEEKLWEFDYIGRIEKGEYEDYFADDEDFKWELEAKLDEELPINETSMKVFWKDRNKRQQISIATYLWNEEE